MSFNQDGSCFCLGTQIGFIVYNISPFKKLCQRELNEEIKIAEILRKTNIFALVGNANAYIKESQMPNDKLIIWDESQKKKISELKLDSEILKAKIKLDKIIASTKDNYLYVIEMVRLKIINIFKIYEYSQGLFAINSGDNIFAIAFPYRYTGYVKIKKYNSKINIPNINAHDTNISFITISSEGNLLATSSEYGTIIRIFSTHDGQLIQELRRGAKKAEIHFITFDLNNKFLACSSDSGTIHIFSIYTSIKYLTEKGIIKDNSNNSNKKEETNIKGEKIEIPKNQKSFIGSIISVLKLGISYFESEWSFAQFRLPKNEDEKTIISFSQFDNSINVLTRSGILYKASFEPSLGGECDKINEINLFKENPEN
jgi:WD40 repeat protein